MAGSRAGADPLATATGVTHKALTPVAGTAMLARVVETLRTTGGIDRIVVSGLEADTAGDLGIATSSSDLPIQLVRGDRTPSESVALAITTLGIEPPVLITTADHPLLTPATLEAFCEGASALSADVAFGLVPAGLVHATFPGIQRTAYRFRDGDFCGCNLYGLLSTTGYDALATWTRVETERKRPWRMVRILGYGTLARFLLGRLALADLTGIVFARTGLRIRPVFLTDPAAGFDVDTPEQRNVAETFLLSRPR